MGNYYTRIVRVYPKNEKIILDKDEISNSIVNTALLDYELNVYDNKRNNCLDFTWRSKRAGGELGIDNSLIDVWEIRGGDYSRIFFNGNLLGNREYNGIFFFKFDEIEISGRLEKLEELMLDLFPYINPKERLSLKKKDESFIIKVDGLYKADNDYEVGNEENRINQLSRDEFLKLKGTTNLIDGVLINEWRMQNLSEFIRKFHLYERSIERTEDLYPDMQWFQLNFKNRPVAKISRNDNDWEPWRYETMNWWDNCMLPEWIEYRIKKNTDDNKA